MGAVTKIVNTYKLGYSAGFKQALTYLVGRGPKSRRYWTKRDQRLYREVVGKTQK